MILYISNIGYVFCHVLALTGFLLLRKDRPDWPRPIKVGSVIAALAWPLAAFNLILVLAGVTGPEGGRRTSASTSSRASPLFLGAGVLVVSVLLFFYRRAVQDKKPITFRDLDVPTMPTEDQMRLLREEVMPDRSLVAPETHRRRRGGSTAPFVRSRPPLPARAEPA